MKGPVDVYRAEILRAVLGAGANESKVVNIERLNQIAAHLVDCEDAKSILRAKGYGAAGMSFVELARSLPENVRGLLRDLFRRQRKAPPMPSTGQYPDQGVVHDIWSAR
jgi:fructose 1,6-bisphosphatase